MPTEQAKKGKKPYTIHKTDVLLNKSKLTDILNKKDIDYKELWEKVVHNYGLDISYKGFMSLITNRVTWKLHYAWAIVDTIDIGFTDIFEVVKVDVEKKKKEKEIWKRNFDPKYKNNQ